MAAIIERPTPRSTIRWTELAHQSPYMALRSVAMTFFYALCFSQVAFLASARVQGPQRLEVEPGIFWRIAEFALGTLPLFALLAILAEFVLFLARGRSTSLEKLLVIVPVVLAIVHTAIALTLFPQELYAKTIAVAVTGALCGQLLGALHVTLWATSEATDTDRLPTFWYIMITLLAITLFGAIRSWTGLSPEAQLLFEHRKARWRAQPVDPLPPPSELAPFL